MTKLLSFYILTVLLIVPAGLSAQDLPVEEIKNEIAALKKDVRGPYFRIKWFCEDGSIRDPKDPCPDEMEGIQHATYKESVRRLADRHHIFFGEILAAADPLAFWDESNQQSRLKQYQLGKYLASVDDGWILRKGQYYRGAVQAEDEQAWGVDFYKMMLSDDDKLKEHYYLLRQSLRDIPHDGDSNLAQQMRSQSKVLADEVPAFMDARIKIHGKPEQADIAMVQEFQRKKGSSLNPPQRKQLEALLETMRQFYAPMNTSALRDQLAALSASPLKDKIAAFLDDFDSKTDPAMLVPALADMLYCIREDITGLESSEDRLTVLDLSNELENILLRNTQEWKPVTVNDLMNKIYALSYAAAGAGLLEIWEWNELNPRLQAYLGESALNLSQLNAFLRYARSAVEWSTALVKANYGEVVERYSSFEPLASGFIDDRIRSSVDLDLGESVSELAAFIAEESALKNEVMDLDQNALRGLNPGYAMGVLEVINGSPEGLEVDATKIYIFQKPPSDLKPVAGIMTVSEGNLVSHVQLLARNLGIPNAALSDSDLRSLQEYDGERVFYAVSNKGNVVLKKAEAMTATEQQLFEKQERNTNRIEVPTAQIKLEQQQILTLSEVDGSASGKLCGPKAANLGQLKSMFPEQVVNGLVLPFGIFKDHMDQAMPGYSGSYWEFLNNAFAKAENLRSSGSTEAEAEKFQLAQLNTLRQAILTMPLKPDFEASLERKFRSALGGSMGSVPVFLRSDTNMEDLKEFTGAGLNLTLFNILDKERILKGIREVWASPYTERSFKWRQKYLTNPENVFPSILIIPSVDVEYSGVLITTGINVGSSDDLTVAFSRGAGGAVDGQSAETRLVTPKTNVLLAPARQPDYIRLPETGGTTRKHTAFNRPILNEKNLNDIRQLAKTVRQKLPNTAAEGQQGAYDVELGFANNKLWLFQIRPFVENKNAKSSTYLNAIAPTIDYDRKIDLSANID
ncbi:PEP/pyruvate-binding domain-containing protein [Croceiramulus getboli]|nr:PEP/pyruvate-binding domain-containing protein [Flavobacteriaceae bacterium YJPT1-3]